MQYVFVIHDYHNDYIRVAYDSDKADKICKEIKYHKQMGGSVDSRVFIDKLKVEQ